MKEYQNHPLAEIFPMLGNGELKDLAEDIRETGLQTPIILFEEKILDGRNRYAACKLAGVEPTFEEYKGSEPLQHIISLNLHRRHLSESQRAVIAGKIANMKPGNPEFIENSQSLKFKTLQPVTQKEAATLLNVGKSSVEKAQRIMREAPEKIKDIETEKKTVNKAMREIKAEQPPKPKIQIHPSVTIDKEREKALRTANNAINELRKIPVNNETRREAFLTVKKWIIDNI